ncbi:MAG: GH92 family glycosyl hydrolase [Sphingomonas sp.]
MSISRSRVARLLGAAALVSTSIAAAAAPQASGYDAVDPMIGTSGGGHTFPGATAPFGMVQLSPDTEIKPFKQSYPWAAGYQYKDPTILGFSMTHFSGAGHSDLGDFLIAPAVGNAAAVKLEPGDSAKPGSGYRSRFSHDTEVAHPGYYAVTLSDDHVRAEMTAGTRVGVHRYTFPADQAAHLILDMRSSIYNYPGKVLWSTLRVRPDGTITGSRQTRGWAPDRKLYFAMRFSAPLVDHAFVDREGDVPYKGFQGPGRGEDDVAFLAGRGLVGRFDFGKLGKPLEVKVAISSVDEAGAVANLDSEAGGFDQIHARTVAAWQSALGVLDIEAPKEMRTSLYTALYHTLLAPSVAGDADGRYRGPDNAVHKADGFTFHSTFSLWDTFRAEHPLMTIIEPEKKNADFINSLIAGQQDSPFGILPVWQFQGRETWCMIGYHAVPVIADAYLKGLKGFDADKALDAMVKSATYGQYGDLKDYMALGYVPIDHEPEAASKTVEYAYDDWTIAMMAKKMGRDDIAATFFKRAQNWRNSFDFKTGWVRARLSNGKFREPFSPVSIKYGSDYTEGNAWQYSWFMPQDEGGLIQALGGDAATVKKLDAMFNYDNSKLDYSDSEDIAGLIGQYIHGNEPSHAVAYLYDYAGKPWRTQERLKQIVDSQYRATPDGFEGNDDLGQMSAWLIFTAMGFYPVTPGSGQYVIGRPFADRIAINLPSGKHFTITAANLSDANHYVGSVTLNGKPLTHSYITHEDIERGGELHFTMQATPNKSWATAPAARPYSMTGFTKR